MKLMIAGYFAFSSDRLGGQIVRSRTILETLQDDEILKNYDYTILDSYGSKIHKSKIVLKFFFNWFFTDLVIILPAQSALRIWLPLTSFLSKFRGAPTHFVSIGGWLPDFLSENNKYLRFIQHIEKIYVQTDGIRERLRIFDCIPEAKIIVLPNYRIYKDQRILREKIERVSRFVFYSRVVKSKGILLAVQAINNYNETHQFNITLDVFGPISTEFVEEFKETIHENPYIAYKGILNTNFVLSTLSQYDVLLFPTFYEGEGFPGAILDAFTAGLPVIATDWKYNGEFVKDNITGFLVKVDDQDDLNLKIGKIIQSPELYMQMRFNCIEQSKLFEYSVTSQILTTQLHGVETQTRRNGVFS